MADNLGGRSSAGAPTRGDERRELQPCNLSACGPLTNGVAGWTARRHWHPIDPTTGKKVFEEAFLSTRPLPTAAEEDAPGPRGRGKGTGKANKKQKPTKEEEYSGRLGGAYQATIPERETMPGSRREAASTPASSAAEAAPCTQIWAAVKPTAAGEHSKQEKKEKEMLTMFASCLVDHFKGRIPADRCLELLYRTRGSGTTVCERFRSAQRQLRGLVSEGTSTVHPWCKAEKMLFSSAMVSNGQKDFSAISESLRQQSITRTAGECSTHYYSGWKIDPAYLELKGSNKYGKVVEIARRDRLERCHNCHQEGVLVYCDGACGKGFHAACVNLKVVPAGSWICSGCDQSPGATARRNTLAEQTARTVVHTKQADADAAAFRAVMASSKALVDAARAGFRDIAAAGCFGPARTAVDAARASLDTSLRNCALAFDPLRQDSLMCD